MKRSIRACALGGMTALFLAGGATWAHAANSDDDPAGAQKRAEDAAGSWDVPRGWDPETAPVPSKSLPVAAAAVPVSASVKANQVAQKTSYYCAPAAVKEALDVAGLGSTQAGLASKLGTTTDGTAWYTGGGYPVARVLNARLDDSYAPVNMNYSPTADQIALYKKRLVADLAGGAPMIGNAWEVASPNAPRLNGHPPGEEIFHFFEIRGYTGSGASTMYEDSVHGATSISWHARVPAYSTIPSDTIARLVGGRGYIW